MIRSQPISIDPPVGEPMIIAADIGLRSEWLISRMLLAILLAAIAALIPGEGPRILDAPLTWSDLFQGPPAR